jgi:hypothetical protein
LRASYGRWDLACLQNFYWKWTRNNLPAGILSSFIPRQALHSRVALQVQSLPLAKDGMYSPLPLPVSLPDFAARHNPDLHMRSASFSALYDCRLHHAQIFNPCMLVQLPIKTYWTLFPCHIGEPAVTDPYIAGPY